MHSVNACLLRMGQYANIRNVSLFSIDRIGVIPVYPYGHHPTHQQSVVLPPVSVWIMLPESFDHSNLHSKSGAMLRNDFSIRANNFYCARPTAPDARRIPHNQNRLPKLAPPLNAAESVRIMCDRFIRATNGNTAVVRLSGYYAIHSRGECVQPVMDIGFRCTG